MNRRRLIVPLLVLTVAGCVQRKVTLTSTPSGAVVIMNDREVGRTPLTTDFLWYGDYEFILRKEGYETLDTKKKMAAPWWQFVPFDFFAEISPTRPVDAHHFNFRLAPARPDVSTDDLIERGMEFHERIPVTQPSSRPSTQPTTGPTSRPHGGLSLHARPTVSPTTSTVVP